MKQISLWMKKCKSVTIHLKNLQILAKENYKVGNDLGPEIIKDMFHFIIWEMIHLCQGEETP